MTSHNKQREKIKPIVEKGLAFVAVTAVHDLDQFTTLGCSPVDRIGWAAFEVLRLVLLIGHWPVGAYLAEGSRIVLLAMHVGPCLWFLLHFATGRA